MYGRRRIYRRRFARRVRPVYRRRFAYRRF